MKSFGKGTRTLQEEISGIHELLQYINVDTKNRYLYMEKVETSYEEIVVGFRCWHCI